MVFLYHMEAQNMLRACEMELNDISVDDCCDVNNCHKQIRLGKPQKIGLFYVARPLRASKNGIFS